MNTERIKEIQSTTAYPDSISVQQALLQVRNECRQQAIDPEWIARLLHKTYERLAPKYGYETRTETKIFDPKSDNGRLMIATCLVISERIRKG